MSDNRQREQDRFPDEMIAEFVCEMALGVAGVHAIGGRRPKVGRAPKGDEGGYTIDVYLIAAFGANIPETAWNVQKNVYDGLKNAYGIEPEDINIHIQGVHTE